MNKISVTTSALIQRAKRGFSIKGEVLKTARAGSATHSIGPFYTIGANSNIVESSRLNITDLAELYLKPHEKLVD